MALLAGLAALPFLEIALFVLVGARIGYGLAIALLLAAGVAGLLVIRMEGFAAAGRLRAAALRREAPAEMLADGALRLAAGLMLIAPGFLTDALALALLFRPSRRALVAWARPRLAMRVDAAVFEAGSRAAERTEHGGWRREERPAGFGGRAGDIPIDADYVDVTDARPSRARPPRDA